jgi:valyl-tRNA synthetase
VTRFALVTAPTPPSGLHIGVIYSLTIADTVVRARRALGLDLTFPASWNIESRRKESLSAPTMSSDRWQVATSDIQLARKTLSERGIEFDSEDVRDDEPRFQAAVQELVLDLADAGSIVEAEPVRRVCQDCGTMLSTKSKIGACYRCAGSLVESRVRDWYLVCNRTDILNTAERIAIHPKWARRRLTGIEPDPLYAVGVRRDTGVPSPLHSDRGISLDQRLVCALSPLVQARLDPSISEVVLVAGLDIQRKWLWLVLACDRTGVIGEVIHHGMILDGPRKASRYSGANSVELQGANCRLALLSHTVGSDVRRHSLDIEHKRYEALERKLRNVMNFLYAHQKRDETVGEDCPQSLEIDQLLQEASGERVHLALRRFERSVYKQLSRELIPAIRSGKHIDIAHIMFDLNLANSVLTGKSAYIG